MASIMEQCAKSIAVAAAFLAFLRTFQGNWSSMPSSTIIVTLTIIQVFSLVNRCLQPATKDTPSAASTLSALPSLLSSTSAQLVIVGLFAGLLACFMHVVGLREAFVPGFALLLGGLSNSGFKKLVRRGEDVAGATCTEDVRSHFHKKFWPQLDFQAEDTSSASVLAEFAAWGAGMPSPCNFGLDTVDTEFLLSSSLDELDQ